MLSSLRIIITGLIARYPLGGMTWHHLQYVLGLAQLGHDVYYLEDSGAWPYTPTPEPATNDCAYNINYLSRLMLKYGLEDRWAYRSPLSSKWYGMPDASRNEIIKSADLLINLSGGLEHPEDYAQTRRLIYIDTDPVFTQLDFVQASEELKGQLAAHHAFFSFGERLSATSMPMQYKWLPTRQPIVLAEWRNSLPRRDVFTTIMNWTSYESITVESKVYGQKDREFMRFLDLPGFVAPAELELAVGEGKADAPRHELLLQKGWHIVDPLKVSGSANRYREYIQTSKAEWSVAKNGYVQGQAGWFSERSACYLAAGNPVVVQNTGFAETLPTGEGILPFATLEEAAAAIREVESNYEQHSRAAAAIAEEYFDSSKVLSKMIDEIGIAP
jgi:hypothetical protein